MRLVRFGLAVALVAILATSASAQEQKKRPGGGGGAGFGGFGGGDALGLVTQQKSVQEELKVSEDQLKKLTEAQEKLRAARPGGGGTPGKFDAEEFRARAEERRKNVDKALTEALKPEQKKRLEQIVLQQTQKNQGMSAALRDQKVVDALKLTAEQKELLTAIGDDNRKLMTELRPAGGGGGGGGGFGRLSEEAQKKLADFRKSADAKITKTFSADQNTAWKDLVGAEFTGKIEQPMRRPGGGGN